jgi:hypothetical protein
MASRRKNRIGRGNGSVRAVKTKYGIKYIDASGKRVKSGSFKPLTAAQRQALKKAQQASARKRRNKKKIKKYGAIRKIKRG